MLNFLALLFYKEASFLNKMSWIVLSAKGSLISKCARFLLSSPRAAWIQRREGHSFAWGWRAGFGGS